MKRTNDEKAIRRDLFAAVSLIALALENSREGFSAMGLPASWPSKPVYTHDSDMRRATRSASLADALIEVLDAPAPAAPKTEVTIEVLGGVVDNVDSTGPVIVKVIDHDHDPINEKDTTSIYNFGNRES